MKRLFILGMVVVMVAIAAMPAAAMATDSWPSILRGSLQDSLRFEHSAKKEYSEKEPVCHKGKKTLYLPHKAAKKHVEKHHDKWGEC